MAELKRKSMLESIVDKYGTGSGNKEYIEKALANGGGFGATAMGAYSTSLVDDNFINTFLSDSSKYFEDARKDYDSLGYGNASSIYSSHFDRLKDLRKRQMAISQYMRENKDSFTTDYYDAFVSELGGYKDAFEGYENAFKSTRDYYSQWDSEDAYNNAMAKWQDYYDRWGHYADEVDYDTWSSKGAGIANPTIEEAENAGYFFGKRIGGADVGNIVTYSRDNWEKLAMGEANGSRLQGRSLYHYMTDDEVGIYNYLLAKDGSEVAQEYLDYIEEDLNARLGTGQAERILGIDNDIARTAAIGFHTIPTGLDQFTGGTRQFFTKEKLPTSATQYASGQISESLDGFGKQAYEAGVTISNMAPSILVGSLLGPAAGSVTMGVSAAGNAYSQKLEEGYSEEQARAYSTLIGAAEGGLQYFLGGIGALAGVSGKTAAKIANIDNALLRAAAKYGHSILKEIGEEELQLLLDPLFGTILFGEEYDAPTIDEMIDTAIVTALSTGVLEGPGTVATAAHDLSPYKGDSEALLAMGRESENAELKALAEELSGGKLTNFKARKLDQAITSADVDTIAQAAEKRLSELGETGDVAAISRAIAKTVATQATEGRYESISPAKGEAALISGSKYGQRVMNELDPVNILSQSHSTGWAENIGTKSVNRLLYNLAGEVSGAEATAEGSNTPVAETAPQSAMSVSEDGITTIEDADGNSREIHIDGIASAEKGEITLKLDDGSTVKASEVSFGTQDEALVYEAVASLDGIIDTDTANRLSKHLLKLGDASSNVYVKGIAQAYTYGYYGYGREAMTGENTLSSTLTEKQRNVAYGLGEKYRNVRVAADQAKATVAKSAKARKGETTGKVHFERNGRTFDQKREVALETMEMLAAVTGNDFYVYESHVDESGRRVMKDENGNVVHAPNGMYRAKDGSIHIDLNAGKDGKGTMLFTVSHELVHYIKQWSPAKFKALADFLVAEYGKAGVSVDELVQAQIAKAKRNGRDISYDVAFEEVVADSCETMLSSGRALEIMAKLKQQDKTLWEKICEFFKDLVKHLKAVVDTYGDLAPDSTEGRLVADMKDAIQTLESLYAEAVVDASTSEQVLAESGIAVDSNTDAGSLFSVRDVLDEKDRQKVAAALVDRFGVTKTEAMDWLKAETSLASLILNPKYSAYLDYEGDPSETAIKTNSDYPQGTVDFSNICKKRREFTQVMNSVMRNFPNHIFAATDLAKIRTIMGEEGMTLPCGICYVEDRRQLDTIVAQDFVEGLKLYREGSTTRPDGKPFNANQLKGLKLTEGDSYIPSIYELVTLEGRNSLKAKNPNMEAAWVTYNNARGMQSVRLLTNEAEYKRQILKYSPKTVQRKNDHGGLRIYSFSDAEMFHLIDIIQVITDSAAKGLYLQGYTKVNEYAKAVKDTGEKLNRSLIPLGDLGYHMEDGKVVLDYDTVEGIDITSEDFFDNRDNPNVGNITIGINDTQIRAAMVSDFVDQIIPFHTGQSEEVLGEKGIATWWNYKNDQTEKDLATGRTASHQVNIYTEVIQAAEEEGNPIQNKRQFVEKFLEVCKKNGLKPRFAQFLNTDAQGNYIYTEGYHKFLVDFKTFAQTEVGEYLPQGPVKPIFDDAYITGLLKAYVKEQKAKDAAVAKSMPRVIERITDEIIKPGSEVKYSIRDEFPGEIDDWNRDGRPEDESFVLGSTGDVIQGLGAIESDIYMLGEKINTILAEHPEITLEEIKKIPQILENPVLILESRNTGKRRGNTRMVVFGSVKAKNGLPVTTILDLRPVENNLVIEDMQKVSSAYTKDKDPVRFIQNSNVLYADKKRTTPLLRTIGFQMPIALQRSGYVGSITYKGPAVKMNGVPFAEVIGQTLYSDRDPAPVFYSQMAKVVEGVKQEKLGAASVVSMLRGKGVKAEEIKWSGIETWLEGKKSVTKAELQEFIAGSMLQIEEETLSNEEMPYSQEHLDQIAKYEAERDIVVENLKSEWKRIVGTDIPIQNFGAGLEHSVVNKLQEANATKKGETEVGYQYKAARAALQRLVEYSDDYFGFDTERDAFREAVRNPVDFMNSYEMTPFQKSVFRDFIKAKEAYNKADGITMEDQRALIAIARSADRFSNRILDVRSEHRAEEAKRMTNWGSYSLNGGTNYRELLFKMPGSSYSNDAMYTHWKGRKGVLAHARIQDFVNKFTGYKTLFIEEIQSDWHNEGHKSGYETKRSEKELAEYQRLYDAIQSADTYEDKMAAYNAFKEYEDAHPHLVRSGKEIPDAPFRANYHEYVLKRLLRMAAEQGYDELAWTTAQIQSERWSDQYAEGYRIEYDQDIPKFLAKYGKKWGAKVGHSYIQNTDYNPDVVMEREEELLLALAEAEEIAEETIDTDIDAFLANQRAISRIKENLEALKGTKVWSMEITDAMRDSVLTEGQPLYQERAEDSVSNRSLLAGALETVAKNDIERRRIAEYQEKVGIINAEERKLHALNEEIKELSFAKGPKDTKRIRDLQFEAKQTANRINTYDRQLLRLEASAPLQAVLDREKKAAYKRAEKKGKEALAAYRERAAKTQQELITRYQAERKRGVESRNKTAMRHKIKDVVNELNKLLLHGTKDKHIMIGLQKAVAEALDAVNMDTVGAAERVAKYNDLIAKATDPDVIASLTATRDRIQEQGDKLGDKLQRLKASYGDIKNSDDPLIANSYDEVIANRIETVTDMVGDTPLRAMTLEQLEAVYDMYKMVLTTIRNSNKAFKAAKNETISTLGNRVMEEVEEVGGSKPYSLKGVEGLKGFAWNGLKPVYAFKAIGSKTLSGAFDAVRAGEDTWAKDVTEAKDFYTQMARKYGYHGWNFKRQYSFTSTTGKQFNLSLEQILSLYAYSKRPQADLHLEKGGFVFDSSIEVVEKKNGIPVKYTVKTATAHNLSKDILAEITGTLTEAQKGFVDEMQTYLSETMGEKGNEVSLEMYGVKLFKEKAYFPLKSAKQFMFEQNEAAGEVRIKNAGFSKETVAFAANPIILSNFMDVWANHVNDMSMYHAFVLPLEDFNRIFNYKTPNVENMDTESVKMYLQNAYGTQPEKYIKQLLTDLNGGARSDSTTGIINKGIGAFKKGAVFASLSVVIQQPSAIARALAYVDAKYFVGKRSMKKHDALWAEVKKYAPVAIIKEMGYFDTNMGMSTVDFITAREYTGFGEKMKALVADSNYRDEILSKAPALADELTWASIWEAVKRETAAKHKGLQKGSEAFLQKAGERFTEVIVNTQVYDSVLSRSAMMRSKDTGMKMATAFMAEPTTTINMVADALIQGKRGNKKYARAAIGAAIASQILNSILVSFVYAGRDDDEEKSYLEKYLKSLTGEVKDSFNIFGYIPFVKDIVSIVQGYEVERSDMSVISDLWKAYEQLGSSNISTYRKVENFAGSIAQIFGLPVKNIMRDARAIYQTADSYMNGELTTKAGVVYAVKEGLTGETVKNQQQLYEAYLSGDKTQIARVEGRYEDQSAINSAIRKALRENDPRIHEAAVARMAGEIAEYTAIARAIIGEGIFSQDNVVAAINAEINAMDKGEDSSSASTKTLSLYKSEDFVAAILDGDEATANTVKNDIIQTAVANGKTQSDAEASFESSARSACKDEFLAGNLSEAKAIDTLVDFCGNTQEEAEKKVGEWAFEAEYGFAYSDRGTAYKNGAISADELIDILIDVGGKTYEDADLQVQVYDWQMEVPECDDITASAIEDYNSYCAPAGISKSDYYDAWTTYKDTPADYDDAGDSIPYSKTVKVMPYINSLPLSADQKTALALCWWSQATVNKYRLW